MLTVWAAFKSLKLWQMAVLVAVMFGVGGATYGVYAGASGRDGVALADNQQIVPVRFGDLVNQVSTSGNLIFPNRETLTFDSQGTVVEILVQEGEQVVRGQALAKLDRTTVASLNQAAAQARVDLQNAVEALDELTTPPPLDLAQIREKVADAEFQLQEATEALADAREPYSTRDIKAQEEVVASARLAFQESKEALTTLLPDRALELAQARQAKADAELGLKQAQETLDSFVPDHLQELAQARQANADAELALEQTQDALAGFASAFAQDLAQARLVVSTPRPAWIRQRRRSLLLRPTIPWSWPGTAKRRLARKTPSRPRKIL